MHRPDQDIPVTLPDDVSASVDGDTVTVEGEQGRQSRTFSHPKITVVVDDGVTIHVESPRRQDLALAKTWASHIRNMANGVETAFEAELKIVYSHFPIKAKVEGDEFVVENFLGERHPRTAPILGETEVDVQGDTVTIEGTNKEHVGQTAANIESTTSISGYDPRVFQDGIYITRKPR